MSCLSIKLTEQKRVQLDKWHQPFAVNKDTDLAWASVTNWETSGLLATTAVGIYILQFERRHLKCKLCKGPHFGNFVGVQNKVKHCATNKIGAEGLACRTHIKLCAACLIIETTNNGLTQKNSEPAVGVWFHSPAAQDQLTTCIKALKRKKKNN